MSGEYESYQGRHVNKLMAIWLWLKIIITIIIKKEFVVCINCSCLVTKSPFWYWDTNKKKWFKWRDAEGTISKVVTMRHCLRWKNLIATTFHISQIEENILLIKNNNNNNNNNIIIIIIIIIKKRMSVGRLLYDIDLVNSCFYT